MNLTIVIILSSEMDLKSNSMRHNSSLPLLKPLQVRLDVLSVSNNKVFSLWLTAGKNWSQEGLWNILT